jgi:hypothetical protein
MQAKLVARSFCAAMCAITLAAPALSQQATLTVDAEYQGATFAAGSSVTFHFSGAVSRGVLKLDFIQNGLKFKAGTTIELAEDGRVLAGELAEQVPMPGREKLILMPRPVKFYPRGEIQQAVLASGSRDANITVPLPMRTDFSIDGRFTQLVQDGVPTSLSYVFAGRTTAATSINVVEFDLSSGQYRVVRGAVGTPQIIGRLVTQRNSAVPSVVIPIIVPTNSTFMLSTKRPLYAAGPDEWDSWFFDGRFQINGYDFGMRPTLWMREGRLAAVRIAQALTIEGVAYASGSVILLNDLGRIVR